ncbi:MAG TPA: hypothetical protein VMD97_04485 [Candidatus Aquilonibacter sp.]|nr:hypothetical protein [Candidatus Aquilonibacter sp.]
MNLRQFIFSSILAAGFAATAGVVQAQTANPPTAPLPTALTTATKLFLGNAGDQQNADCLRAYNDFYAGIAALKRFQQVTDPNQADLILELHYEIDLGQAIASHDTNHSVRQFRVVLIDPHSHAVLWTLVESTNYAIFQSNRNKNLDETVAALVHDFDQLVSPTPTPPNNKSKIEHF